MPHHEDKPATGPLPESLQAVERMQLQDGKRTPCDLIASDVNDAREDLVAALGRADRFDEREAHERIAEIVTRIDALMPWLSERGIS